MLNMGLVSSTVGRVFFLTYKNKKIVDNHICTIANYVDYETKMNYIISTLKESWKNEYKNNKV